ncbi:MAG: hypothetical protein QOG25_2382, partial [Acetobacteraceae bacterium]|nr:hypothetical protein [Acetobacteraceae bacterium]
MRLSTRLVLLVLGCLLPILTAQVYSQISLHAERHEQLGDLALRQAELVNADITSIIDGVHQLGTLAGQFPSIRDTAGRCSERLTALRQSLNQYHFLALFAPADGTLVCASDGVPAGLTGQGSPWLTDLLKSQDWSGGQFVSEGEATSRYLPVAVRIPRFVAGETPRVFIAALD